MAVPSAQNRELHEAVLRGDHARLRAALAVLPRPPADLGVSGGLEAWSFLVNWQDVAGNTALHLAIWLADDESAHALLDAGASPVVSNRLGGSPLDEAIATGNRTLWTRMRLICFEATQAASAVCLARWAANPMLRSSAASAGGPSPAPLDPQLPPPPTVPPPPPPPPPPPLGGTAYAKLARFVDDALGRDGLADSFTLQVGWNVSSWIPLLRFLMPSDEITVRKRGSLVRIDFTFTGMRGRKSVRRSASLLVMSARDSGRSAEATADATSASSTAASANASVGPLTCVLVDWDARQYRPLIGDRPDEAILAQQAAKQCLEPIMLPDLLLTECTVRPSLSWFGYNVYETVGGHFHAQKYDFANAQIVMTNRIEHLSDEAAAALAERQRIDSELDAISQETGRNYTAAELSALVDDMDARREAVTAGAIKPYPRPTAEAIAQYSAGLSHDVCSHGWARRRLHVPLSGSVWVSDTFPIPCVLVFDLCSLFGMPASDRTVIESVVARADWPFANGSPVKFELTSGKVGKVVKFNAEILAYNEDPVDAHVFNLPADFERVSRLPWATDDDL